MIVNICLIYYIDENNYSFTNSDGIKKKYNHIMLIMFNYYNNNKTIGMKNRKY